jgi:hypothetical protein
MNNQEEQMKDIPESRKTCAVVFAAIGLAFGGLAYAAGDSDKEGKGTLSRETTHGNESTIGDSKSGTSGAERMRKPEGTSLGGSSTDKATNTDIGGGGTGSGAVLQGGVETNKQGTAGGADSMGGMRSGTGTGQSSGQGARSGPGSGGSGSGSGK